jgi:membrane peptidoglycan carboxypeptidase
MSERTDNAPYSPAPNWVTPRGARRYASASMASAAYKVPALPPNLDKKPAQDGAWHLPDRTTFSASDEVDVRPRQTDGGIRPEDLLAQVLGRPTVTTPEAANAELRPEDMILARPSAQAAAPAPAPAPEDMLGVLPAPSVEAADEELPAPEDLIDLEKLGAVDDAAEEASALPEDAMEALRQALPFDDDDDDRLSVSEYLSVLDLESAAPRSQDADTVSLNADDLSPAQQAALQARMAQAEENAAEIARRMAAQLAGGDATLDMPATGGMGSQAATVTLTPEEEALAEKFRATARGIAELRAAYQRGEISYDDVQNRQREYQIYDERSQSWWMMGIDSGKWFRFDSAQNQWIEAEPPVPLARPATPTATGQFKAEDIISGSLPYLPQDGPQEYSSQPLVDPYGDGGTPIPRPGQPIYDLDMTMPGNAASLQTLPGAAATIPNMNSVDAQYTMPMNTVPVNPGAPTEFGTPMVNAPDYGYQQAPTFESLKQAESQSRMRVLLLALFAIAGCGVLTLAAGAVGVIMFYNNTIAPYEAEIAALANYRPTFQTARILDANGDLIVELNSQQGGARRVVPLSQMSPFVLHAVISTENPTFYDDPGFDFFAIVRALLQNLGSQQIVSGASTITQQLARNLILRDSSPTAERKLTEIMLAMAISERYSKNDILQLYMNEAFFGNQSYGVQAAAEFYFGIDAADLNMAQSALLAGIISSPLTFDPVTNFTAANDALKVVLRRMINKGCIQFQHGPFVNGQPFCISEATFVDFNGERVQLLIDNGDGTYGGLLALQLAEVQTRRYLPRATELRHPHFVLYVQSEVERNFGPNAMFQRGFTIYTTLNPRIQRVAEQALAEQVAALVNNGVNTGAVMVTDPQTGAIRAMVGSPDFNNERIDGQVDNTRTWQQPGSAIKPMLYTAALEGGPNGYLTPASILWDVPSSYPIAGQQPYTPVNFSGVFYGPVPLRFALQNSYNVSAVKAFEFIGAERFVDTATRMGIQFLPNTFFGLPSALGANDVRLIDMMKAYGTIATGGRNVPLYTIDRITEDVNGVEIEVPLPERPPVQQVISPQVAFLMQNILSDDNARAQQFGQRGPLTLANIGIPTQGFVGAKTGTSNEGRDLWTMGFTSNAVVGVWLGTFDNAPTVGVSGSTAPALLWNRVMVEAVSGRAPTAFTNPGGVVQNTVCRDTGTLAGPNCANRVTEIYIQTQPPPPDTEGVTRTLNVDSWSGLIANEFCPENVVSRTFANISDPFALNWIQNTPQGRQWAQLVGLPANLQSAPTAACSMGQTIPTVVINSPTAGQALVGPVNITGQISAGDFARFDLEFASAASPNNFTRIASSSQQFPSPGSTLGTWDTTTVPNGSYTLRLVAFSTTGGTITRSVNVTVNNIPPTPTPPPFEPPVAIFTPTPAFTLPTPMPIFTPQGSNGGFVPLPFDPSQATATATLAP